MNKLPHVSIMSIALLTGATLIITDVFVNIPLDEHPSISIFNEIFIPLLCLGVVGVIAEVINKRMKLGIQQPLITVFFSGLLFAKLSPIVAYASLPIFFLGNALIAITAFYIVVLILSYSKIVMYK